MRKWLTFVCPEFSEWAGTKALALNSTTRNVGWAVQERHSRLIVISSRNENG